MILKNLSLKNFRLHKNSSLIFSDRLNYIIGGNGHGKTTILEAIYYLCTTKNLNKAADSEAVSLDEQLFEVSGLFKAGVDNNVKIIYDSERNKKAMLLNNKQFYRASEIIGSFPVVTLTRTDHNITYGPPAERRKFIDSVISQGSATYLKILMSYNRTLRQRSRLFSLIKENYKNSLLQELDAWTESLVKDGVQLIKHRIDFIEEFSEYLSNAYRNVMAEAEIPVVKYLYGSDMDDGDIETGLRSLLKSLRDDELRRGVNLAGPHKDDLAFFINNLELKKFGSQGQHKTFQISLRFAELFYLADKLGNNPMFLLDDVFGELDSQRAGKISAFLPEVGQAFITLTDLADFSFLSMDDDSMVFNISRGEVSFE